MDISLLVFAAAVIGSAVGAIASNLTNGWLARSQRKETKRLERLHYLNRRVELLTDLRAELQPLQADPSPGQREVAYGKAYAVMLSSYDEQIVKRANDVMHGGFYPQENKNEKLDAIDFALERLGKLIWQVME